MRIITPLTSVDHSPIIIDGNTELEAFCTVGDGTLEDPYIIENYKINLTATPDSYGIIILFVDKYLIIQNCTIFGGFTGIGLQFCDNIILQNNTLTNITRGIELNGNSNSNIGVFSNNCSFNTDGIYISHSFGIEIMYNSIINNTEVGIHAINVHVRIGSNAILGNALEGLSLTDSWESQITDNNISNNGLSGMKLDDESRFNLVKGNNCSSNNGSGIEILNSNRNRVFENIASENIESGIKIEDSTNTTITRNLFNKNKESGIELLSSHNNSIWNNLFIENEEHQAYLDYYCTGNVWDNGTIGNYYSDYTERFPDAKMRWKDVTWKTPYDIDVPSLVTPRYDNRPLINPEIVQYYQPPPVYPRYVITGVIIAVVGGALGVILYKRHKKRKLTVAIEHAKKNNSL